MIKNEQLDKFGNFLKKWFYIKFIEVHLIFVCDLLLSCIINFLNWTLYFPWV